MIDNFKQLINLNEIMCSNFKKKILLFCILFFCTVSSFAYEANNIKQSTNLVVVFKSINVLYLFSNGKIIKEYDISLGYQPEGTKREKGDFKTPEGEYTLDWKNPNSKFYRSIHISYPNQKDIDYAKKHGLNTGGDIMVHGQPVYDNKQITGDWTHGCIAVSNEAIDEIWALVEDGTPIHIYP